MTLGYNIDMGMAMAMTEQQKTRDMAEKVMGLTWKSDPGIGCWVERFGAWRLKFDPFTSRDDAHELLGKLTDEQWLYFGTLIRRQIRESGDYIQLRRSLTRCLLMLTPAQIAEAVWRAICQ